jgi:hypothetical protein
MLFGLKCAIGTIINSAPRNVFNWRANVRSRWAGLMRELAARWVSLVERAVKKTGRPQRFI